MIDTRERLAIPPVEMPEQAPTDRIRNVEEVPLGYTPEMAMLEAKRCLQCKIPFCVEGCPVQIDIPGFIRILAKIKYAGIVSFEYEKDANDPLAGLAESVGYVRGVMAAV